MTCKIDENVTGVNYTFNQAEFASYTATVEAPLQARIAQLEEALEYISTLHRYDVPADIADKALVDSPSTWLSEHDKEVGAKERERCAQECDIEASTTTLNDNKDYDEGRQMGAIFCGKRIRSLKND